MGEYSDLVVRGFEAQQEGLGQMAARRRHEDELNRPLPDFLQAQLNPPVPQNPVSLGDVRAASPNYAPGQGGAPWANSAPQAQEWSPPEAASLGQPAAPPAQSLAADTDGVEAAARAYASGEKSMEEALAQARKYTQRDLPAVDAYTKLRGQRTNEDYMKIERERTERAYGVTDKKTEGRLTEEKKRQEGRMSIAKLKDAGMDREGMRRASTAQLKMMNDFRIAELNARKALEIADKRIAATNDPELNMLKVEAEVALGEYKTATQGINGAAYIIKSDKRPELEADHNEARDRFLQATKQLHSYIAASGRGVQPVPGPYGGGQPAPVPQGSVAPLPENAGPGTRADWGNNNSGIPEPTEEQLNAPGARGMPPLSQPVPGRKGPQPGISLPPGAGPAPSVGQGAQLPPSPVLGSNGKPIVKRLANGQLVMKMTNGKAAPYDPAQWR